MRYSVWNPGTRGFDYYDTSELEERANVEKPEHLKARALGATAEQACWPLPSGAIHAGSGPRAEGRVAISPTLARSLGASGEGDLSVVKGLLLACAGALGVKYLLSPKRGRR